MPNITKALPNLAKVFQFIISDAGPEGKFVLDLKNGSGAAKAGEEAGAVRVLVGQESSRIPPSRLHICGVDVPKTMLRLP